MNYRKKICGVLTLAFIFFLPGCASLTEYSCPYVVGDIKSVLGDGSGSQGFYFSGVTFNFFNSSEKTISEFSVSFRLYNSDGENPFIGTNCVTATNSEIIGSHSTSEVTISIDDAISIVPEEPYQIDYFYISKIKYTDGSIWQDEYGIYAL